MDETSDIRYIGFAICPLLAGPRPQKLGNFRKARFGKSENRVPSSGISETDSQKPIRFLKTT